MKLRRNADLIPETSWLHLKPYDRATGYDRYYIGLASRLLDAFHQVPPFLRPRDERDRPAETLALVLTSYLEDIVNEIGIWRVFTETNQAQLGYYLPFILDDDEAYEPGEFDYRDIRYLIWHFLNRNRQTVFLPNSPLVETLAEIAWDVLEPVLNDAPETDFYRTYLSIPDGAHFFEVKKRLHWFAIYSYPLCFEFGPQLNETYDSLTSSNESLAGQDAVVYQLVDEYAFSSPSSYCALTVPQWLGAVAGVSPEMGQQMRNLRHRLSGRFKYHGQTADHYLMRPAHHPDILHVAKDSATLPASIKTGDWIFMTLVSYNGRLMVSGMLAILGKLPERSLGAVALPFAMKSEADQTMVREVVQNIEADFRAEFGDLVYVSQDYADLRHRMEAFWIRNTSRIQAGLDEADASLLSPDHIKKLMQSIPDTPGTAVVMVPGDGIQFDLKAGALLHLLHQPNLADRARRTELFGGLVMGMHPLTVDYLLRQAPDTPVWFPLADTQYNVRPYLQFLLRYHQPENYLPPIPRVTVADRDS